MRAPLDPAIQGFLSQLHSAPGPRLRDLPPAQAREMARGLYKMLDGEPVAIGAVNTILIASADGAIPARLYSPISDDGASLPGIIYYHGGGFVFGDADCYDNVCRRLANGAGCRVISVDYRLAPEHPFPAACNDAIAVARDILSNARRYGVDPARIAVAGDSAGGNLAAVTAQAQRGDSRHPLALQILINPTTQLCADTPSMAAFAEGRFLERDDMDWCVSHYLGQAKHLTHDPRASPLLATDLAGLPRALVFTAGHDPLRDEGALYAERLKDAGVETTCVCFENLIHNFIVLGAVSPAAHAAIERVHALVKDALHDA